MEDKKLKAFGKDIQKHLLSGVSFMIPLVVLSMQFRFWELCLLLKDLFQTVR